MTSITRTFNTDEIFWETNPSFLTISKFEHFYNLDKSKGKKKSSQIMWAIAFLLDPHPDNVWKNLNESDKKMLIVDDYLKDDKFKWDEYQDLINEYYNRVLTLAQKDFYELQEKMTERKEFIKNTPYSLDSMEEIDGKMRIVKGTAAQLDKMVVDTAKLYEQLELVKQKLEKEAAQDGETKGGMQESATEKGLL